MKISLANMSDVYKSEQCSVETMELKGYRLLKEYFVDNSGFGSEDELAMTRLQFETELSSFLAGYGKPVYTTITGAGQFQVYVGVFEKCKASIYSQNIAPNTRRIFDDKQRPVAIRLYDTDIITYKEDQTILSSGGFETVTTKARLNQFMPFGYSIVQKNYTWYLSTPEHGLVKFFDGINLNDY